MSGVHIPSVSSDAASYYDTYNLNPVDRRNSSESQEVATNSLFQTQSHQQSQYHDQQHQSPVSQYHSTQQHQQHVSSIVSLSTSAQHVVGINGADAMAGASYQTSAFTAYPHTTYHHPQTPLSAPVCTTYDSVPITTSNPLSLGGPTSVSGADHHAYPGMVSTASATSDTASAMFPTSPPPPPTNMQQTMSLQTPSINSQTGCLSSSDMQFECILEASTAAAQKIDEPSLTYLNKGQLYGISLLDKMQTNTVYTTTMRIAFHEDSHRKNSSTYWNFWLNQQEVPRYAQAIELDKAGSLGITMTKDKNFDKVSFQWHGLRGARLMVRFNCLSTDFSRIKGVKGIPLRINMDTYQITPNYVATSISAITNASGDMHTGSMSDLAASISQMSSPIAAGSSSNRNGGGAVQQRQQQYPQSSMTSGSSKGTLIERCYARVKLFRDKGAERKNKDDQKHLDKLWARQKSKLVSQNSNASAALKQQKLADFTMSYSLVQEVTVFDKCSLSDDEDDNEEPIPFDGLWATGAANMLGSPNTASSMSTPVGGLSSMSINIPGIHLGNFSTPLSPAAAAAAAATYMRKRSSVDGPELMFPSNSKRQFSPSSLNNTTIGFNNTEPVGVDPSYVPNPNKKKAVLAIYAKFQGEHIYRAIYLERLDVDDLVSKMKQYLDPKLFNIDVKDLDVLRMTKNELTVKVDDSMLRQMKDEQDMEVEWLVSQGTGVPTICLRF